MPPIAVLHFSDPGCPWAYSISPSLAALRWRYGDQLDWRLVTIGLTESADQYVQRGYTPERLTLGYRRFRRYGMPFATAVRSRVAATSPACRAIVAARLRHPGREHAVHRALQLAWFTTTLVLDEPDAIAQALAEVDGIDAGELAGAIEDEEVVRAYERDRVEARAAAGSAAELQGKTRRSDGPVRFTAPTLVFERDGSRLVAGGFQPLDAYDVLVANLDPDLEREPPPRDAAAALARFPEGLATQEVAVLLAHGNDPPDRSGAEEQLIGLLAAGDATRTQVGDDALWRPIS